MPLPTWDDIALSVPLNGDGKYQIVAMNPQPFDAFGHWQVLIVVPAFSIMSGVLVEATDMMDAVTTALEFANKDYDRLIALAIKKRQYLMRN